MGEERLEVDVPDPRHVLPVRDGVVQRDHEYRRHARLERPQRLVRPGGILDQENDDRLLPLSDALEAPECRAEPLEAGADRLERRPEREAEARRGGRVVDVVEARERELDLDLAARGDEREPGRAEAGQLDVPRDEVELGSGMPARRAAVGAEMADVRSLVLVRRPAADAVLRVGCVLERWTRVSRIVEAVAEDVAPAVREVGDDWVVRVDDECRVVREASDGVAPPLGDDLELAVAVELVAEEVPERHRARPRALHRLRQRSLVDLEEPELGAVRAHERRCDPREEVRSRSVPRERPVRAQDPRGHRGRRRLSVGRRDERGAEREAGGQRIDRGRVELPEELARDRRATAAAGRAREAPDGAGGERLEANPSVQRKPRTRARVAGGEVGRVL